MGSALMAVERVKPFVSKYSGRLPTKIRAVHPIQALGGGSRPRSFAPIQEEKGV